MPDGWFSKRSDEIACWLICAGVVAAWIAVVWVFGWMALVWIPLGFLALGAGIVLLLGSVAIGLCLLFALMERADDWPRQRPRR